MNGGELVVMAPLAIEARAVRTGLPMAKVVKVGMGPRKAARGVMQAVGQGNGATKAVAVAGFCGALDPTLRAGDVVVASEVRGPDGARPLPSSGMLVAAIARLGLRPRLGPILSVDHLVRSGERRALAETGAIAVDMESAWLAPAANGHPLAVLRVVTDGPGRDVMTHPMATAAGGIRAYRTLAKAAPALASWAGAVGSRRVLLAGPRSFCAGVERAIEIVERALDRYGPPIYVRKQIVHNVHVVHDLEQRGAVFVDAIEEVPEGAAVVFSAHGVSPEVRRESAARNLHVIDATCPLVTKVHTEAKRFASAGYTIFLIGHQGHEEVEGTTGEAPEHIHLIQPEDRAGGDAVHAADPSKVAFLTQTTLAVDEVTDVVDDLRTRFPALARALTASCRFWVA